MPSKYLSSFNRALERYCQKDERPGFGFGFFSSWRHKYRLYPHIQQLHDKLAASADEGSAMGFILNYFGDPNTRFNHHSFASYFQEQLTLDFPEERWEGFDPVPVEFYQSQYDASKKTLLYRGSRQPKEDAFEKGMLEGKHSNNISDYFSGSTYSIGVSTSKSYETAYQYAVNEFITVTPNGAVFRHYPGVYVYVINYRGLGGVDIDKSLERYRGFFSSVDRFEAKGKNEVNIIGKIDREDIVGAFELVSNGKPIWHPNERYQPDRRLEVASSKPVRLGQLFLT